MSIPRFYFAWVDATETTFGVEHHREDEKIFTFSIEHAEGEIPTLTIDIRNPKVGLLAPGRKAWAWFAWDNGVGTVTPLFFGRLVGIPTNLLAEACTLTFIAKPLNYYQQKAALAETLKVRPYYDSTFIAVDERSDPDTVLEGYPMLWHVDRTSLVVTASDILYGEDGNEDFHEDDALYDSVEVTLNQSPLVTIDVEATVEWTQKATGTVNLGFRYFNTLSNSIGSGWPKTGDDIGQGWKVAAAYSSDPEGKSQVQMVSYSTVYENQSEHHTNGEVMSMYQNLTLPEGINPNIALNVALSSAFILNYTGQTGLMDPYADPPINRPAYATISWVTVPGIKTTTSLVLGYEAERDRTEKLTFSLHSDLQAVVTLPDDEEEPDHETIKLSSEGDLPIADASMRSYFPTDRGLWSLEYLISLARAHLLSRSRVVEISFDCRFEDALGLSCRKNAQLFDPRLPGGKALGKIIAYKIEGDGMGGKLIGNVTIGCAIGYGGVVTAVPGSPAYCDESYVGEDYQFYIDAVIVLASADVGYSIPIDAATDDGLVFPLDARQVVVREEMTGAESTYTLTKNADGSKNLNWGESDYAYELELRPVTNGPFDAEYTVTVTDLVVPKMIDLEAAST